MKSSVFKANVFALLLVLLQIVVPVFLGPLVHILGYSNILVLDEYIFLLLPCILFVFFNGSPLRETFSIRKIKITDVVIIIIIAVLCQPIAGFLSELSSLFFRNPVEKALEKLNSLSLGFMLFYMAVTPAICEEAVTRGIVLYGYRKERVFTAAVINGLIFGILHLSPQQFLYAFLLGAIFAYLVRATGSIFSSMLCHFTFNGIQVVLSRAIINGTSTQAQEAVKTGYNKFILLLYQFSIALIFFIVVMMLIKYLSKLHKSDDYLKSVIVEPPKSEDYTRKSKINVVLQYGPLIILVMIYMYLMINKYIY